MSFLEKLSKLSSPPIEDNGSSLTVSVYDDELSNDKRVMWLYGEFQEIDNRRVLYIHRVDFDDSLFFKMPKKRQNMCASVLFKNFVRHYLNLYGPNSEEWLPIAADFRNYKLKEKFEKGIEKGIFPPESKGLIKFQKEEDWQNDETFNMENREFLYNLKNNPNEFFPNFNIENGFIVNQPLSLVEVEMQNVFKNIGIPGNKLEGYIKSGLFCVKIPKLVGNSIEDNSLLPFMYNMYNKNLNFISMNSIEEIQAEFSKDLEFFESMLDIVQTYSCYEEPNDTPISGLFVDENYDTGDEMGFKRKKKSSKMESRLRRI